MLHSLKKRLYFVVAGYFAFWARFILRRWKPRIILVTGSSGKTTLLHLVEAQLGEKALYSHEANSTFGIPFHVLGMEPNVGSKVEWLQRVLTAPFYSFRKPPSTKLYVVEADCERPHEGAFLAKLLKPEVVLWVSVFNTHAQKYDSLMRRGTFATHEDAIAYEYGHYLAAASRLVAVNGDQPAIAKQLARVNPEVSVKKVRGRNLTDYTISKTETIFTISGERIRLSGLHPKEVGISLQLVNELLGYLAMPLDPTYAKLAMPPGRSSVFVGKKNTVLVDSSYNTGLGATEAILQLFAAYPNKHKWIVMGDILELGSLEAAEHTRLAEILADLDIEQLVLVGPRTRASTYPAFQKLRPAVPVVTFEMPNEALKYLEQHLRGGEAIAFKGGRFLEGIIEQLLADPKDASGLAKRGAKWIKIRQKWGLPR